MSANEHKHCYGTMFPSTLHPDAGQRVAGKAFWLELKKIGGTFAWDRKVGVDAAEWDDCLACPEFEPCYRLCIGQITMESAITAH